jgi:hypothetical protein
MPAIARESIHAHRANVEGMGLKREFSPLAEVMAKEYLGRRLFHRGPSAMKPARDRGFPAYHPLEVTLRNSC